MDSTWGEYGLGYLLKKARETEAKSVGNICVLLCKRTIATLKDISPPSQKPDNTY